MCVDYATKFRERQGAEWALRNAKLRMSRKLIFASGLMICFSCYLQSPPPLESLFESHALDSFAPLVVHLRTFVGKSPTDILADALGNYTDDATAAKFFDAYDRFIEFVGSGTKREQLKKLAAKDAKTDSTFIEIRRIADDFQDALNRLFFDSSELKLNDLTRKYGLF